MTRRIAAMIALGALVLMAAVGMRTFVLPPSDAPDRVDAIVVLGGGEPARLQTGLDLFANGVGGVLVLSAGTGPAAADHGIHCDDATVVCVEPIPATTAGEARTVTALAAERGWTSLAVVTSTYHLTRSRVLFEQCFDGRLSMAEAPVPRARMAFLGDIVRELPDIVAGAAFARAC